MRRSKVKNYHEHAVSRVVNMFLFFAYRQGANGILIEPEPDITAVFYLLGDEKKRSATFPLDVFEQVSARTKKMAGMKPSDTDGLIRVRMEDKTNQLHCNYNLHVRVNPPGLSEHITLRFADADIPD